MASPHFPNFIDELEARTEITDAVLRFVRGVDRQDWALARSTYHDDAVDEHGFFTGPPDEFLALVERMHAQQQHSMHVMTNMLIEFAAADRALVETYVIVFQRFGPDAAGVKPGTAGSRKIATARYLDRFEKRAGAWKVARRTLVFGDGQDFPLEAPVSFPPGFAEQRHGMDDPLYAAQAAHAAGRRRD
ncbi:MAG: nuclear transport factor 2 family protein [Rhodospirillaceae bacterium]